jgi:hypothetical protein
MRIRCWASLSGRRLVIMTAAIILAPTVGQGQVVPRESRWDPDYEPPRTAAGYPDLQGNWTNVSLTPFQRAEGREPLFSWDEVDQIEGRAVSLEEAASRPSDPNRGLPPISAADQRGGAGGGTGGYNFVYIDRGTNVAIVDGEPRTSLVTNPPNGRIPAVTPEGQRRRAAARQSRGGFEAYDHPELRPLGERCIVSFGTSAGPPMIPNGFYNNNYTIVQNEDHVIVMAEMVHDYRVIRIGEREPMPDHITPYFGNAWGHWEGNTLVVETTNINPDHPFRGIPASAETKVHERFTRVDDDTVLYGFTIDDPAYEQPWGGEIPFERLDDLVFEYACHEGNYALTNILSGARYQESLTSSSGRE